MSCVNPHCRDGVLGVLTELGMVVHCDSCRSSLGILFGVDESQLGDVFDGIISNCQPCQVEGVLANA